MATAWAAQRCLANGQVCQYLLWHRAFAIPATSFVVIFVLISIWVGGWPRSQWPFLASVLGLVFLQVSLGFFSLHFGLSQPLVTVCHQLVACLLIAFLAALSVRRPETFYAYSATRLRSSSLEPCNG